MINVLVDGNYIFHKTFGVFAGYGDIDPAEKLATQEQQSMFIRKVSTDLCYTLKSLPTGGRLIFTIDDRSWRRDYYEGYKSSREEKGDDSADWSIFFNLMHSFGEHIEKMGFIFTKSKGSEGDDLIWGWADKFAKLGENSIIVSGDKDLHQLAAMRDNGTWTIAWNSKAKNNVLTIHPLWIEKYLNKKEEVSIFNMGSVVSEDKDRLKELFNKAEVNIVDTRKFIFVKMLAGDPGDDVPSIWSFYPKPDGRITRVTDNKASKIWDAFMETEWKDLGFHKLLDNLEFLDWVAGQSIKIIKGIDSTENREIAKENLIRNFDLMWLDANSYPHYVLSGINEEVKRGLLLEKQNVTLDRIKILQGTNWVDSAGDINENAPSEYNPFKLF